jgi:uncharacterized Zn-finger protein
MEATGSPDHTPASFRPVRVGSHAMKLNCPYCGEKIPYDGSLAGQSIACPYCEKLLKMPAFDELPPEQQDELRQTAAKADEKQKRKYRRRQDRFLKDLEKDEKHQQDQEASTSRPTSEAQIQGAPAAPRVSTKPLGVVLAAIYSAIGAWQYLSAYQASSSLGGSSGVLEALGGKGLGELLGTSGGLLEGLEAQPASSGGLSAVLFALLAMASLLSALLLAAICYGLLTLQKWSYRLTFIAYGMTGAVALLAIVADNSRQNVVLQLPNMIAAVVIIVYFSQPRVKALFR